jgi:hypothetical protein
MGIDEKKSKVQMVIGFLQNGTPKNPTPHFPNLMSLVGLFVKIVCLFD